MRYFPLFIALPLFSLATIARADNFSSDGLQYQGTINGLRYGKLSATLTTGEHQFDLDKITSINLDATPKFLEAEQARETDAKKSAGLYKQIIPTINKAELKQLAELRAIAPTDADGQWLQAVILFLDVYQASPIDPIWQTRPTHFPAQGSSMLPDSAARIADAIKTTRSDDARKNLKSFLLETYTHAGNTQEAAQLAKELSIGITADRDTRGETPAGNAPANNPANTISAANITEIETAIRAKNYDAALQRADALLATADGEPAVQLYTLKSRAYEFQNHLDDATAALLRIPAHYPASSTAPAALLHAAELQKRLNRPAAAKSLLQEILDHYPTSKEAITAKNSP